MRSVPDDELYRFVIWATDLDPEKDDT